MTATKRDIKDMADRLISTLDTMLSSEQADAIVRDVAEELYVNVLGVKGKIVVDPTQPTGHMHGNFGKGKRMLPIARFRFEVKK